MSLREAHHFWVQRVTGNGAAVKTAPVPVGLPIARACGKRKPFQHIKFAGAELLHRLGIVWDIRIVSLST